MNRKILHLKRSDPVMKSLIEGITLRAISNRRGHFEALVEAIVSQQLSVKAADTIFARLVALVPGKPFPTPQDFLALSPRRMRSAGLSRMKVSFIKDLARKVLDGTVDLKKIGTWTDDEVVEHLTAVKGIGTWTAEMFLIFSLGREDVFSYGDLGLRNAIKKAYNLRKPPSEQRARAIALRWKPYRSLASRYLWASLGNTPVQKKQKRKRP